MTDTPEPRPDDWSPIDPAEQEYWQSDIIQAATGGPDFTYRDPDPRPVSPPSELTAAIRQAITNAYYEARDHGETMEKAADIASADVMLVLDAARAAPCHHPASEHNEYGCFHGNCRCETPAEEL